MYFDIQGVDEAFGYQLARAFGQLTAIVRNIQNDHALQLSFAQINCIMFWRLDFCNRAGVPAGAVMRPFGRACVQQSFPRRPRPVITCIWLAGLLAG